MKFLTDVMTVSGNDGLLVNDLAGFLSKINMDFICGKSIVVDDGCGGFVVSNKDVSLAKFSSILESHSYKAKPI